MTRGRRLAAAAVLTVAAAGCGLGPGPESKGTAALTVTRDYGAKRLVSSSEDDPSGSETVLRFLDRNAQITTRYGGGFVQSIDGLSGAESGGRRFDWFFYVNGIESPVGATQVPIHGGDRIWWDYRDWTSAMRVPAVVGSWPQPFAADQRGHRGRSTAVECAGPRGPCDEVASGLRAAGIRARVIRGRIAPTRGPRVLVGRWGFLRSDPSARQLAAGPATSGVFARFHAGARLDLLDVRGQIAERRGPRTGLVAAVRDGDRAPTWLVTAGGEAGVRRAAALVDTRDLRDRYAVAGGEGAAIPLPLVAGGGSAG